MIKSTLNEFNDWDQVEDLAQVRGERTAYTRYFTGFALKSERIANGVDAAKVSDATEESET